MPARWDRAIPSEDFVAEQSPLAAVDVFTGICEGGNYECMLYIWNNSAVDIVLDKGAPLGYASGKDLGSSGDATDLDIEAILEMVDSPELPFHESDNGLLPNWTPFFPIEGREGFEEIRTQSSLPPLARAALAAGRVGDEKYRIGIRLFSILNCTQMSRVGDIVGIMLQSDNPCLLDLLDDRTRLLKFAKSICDRLAQQEPVPEPAKQGTDGNGPSKPVVEDAVISSKASYCGKANPAMFRLWHSASSHPGQSLGLSRSIPQTGNVPLEPYIPLPELSKERSSLLELNTMLTDKLDRMAEWTTLSHFYAETAGVVSIYIPPHQGPGMPPCRANTQFAT